MLTLTREVNQEIELIDELSGEIIAVIRLKEVRTRNGKYQARIGVEADRTVKIMRAELTDK
jgi:sRNA-binding carbon storage regulator CsrA